MQESIVFLLRVQCRRKESSRLLSHLLMSFLLFLFRQLFKFSFTRDMYLVLCSKINWSKIGVKCLLRPHVKSFQRVSNDSSV